MIYLLRHCEKTMVLCKYGRTCNFESLMEIKSPDLFSIDHNGYHHHEL
ncbi:MAG: hypothetical protein COB08_000345 [Rhodobacteraceae bacterium]|nr:hypothetical protein [Paracoccaceae bacterium]